MPHHDRHAPPFPVRVLLTFLTGIVAVDLLPAGRLREPGRQAPRHGPGAVDAAGHLHPQWPGFLVYFLLRKPLIQYCPKCGDRVEKGFHFCAKCGCALSPTCGSCGQPVSSRLCRSARTAGRRWRAGAAGCGHRHNEVGFPRLEAHVPSVPGSSRFRTALPSAACWA